METKEKKPLKVTGGRIPSWPHRVDHLQGVVTLAGVSVVDPNDKITGFKLDLWFERRTQNTGYGELQFQDSRTQETQHAAVEWHVEEEDDKGRRLIHVDSLLFWEFWMQLWIPAAGKAKL